MDGLSRDGVRHLSDEAIHVDFAVSQLEFSPSQLDTQSFPCHNGLGSRVVKFIQVIGTNVSLSEEIA